MSKRWVGMLPAVALVVGFSAAPAVAGTSSDCVAVKAKLLEYKIKLSMKTVEGGCITFKIVNRGVEDHELVITKAKSAHALPEHHGVVDEADVDIIDESGELASRKHKTLTVNLTAGKYVLFCNVRHEHGDDMGGMEDMGHSDENDEPHGHEKTTSESHFGEGMHTVFTVT